MREDRRRAWRFPVLEEHQMADMRVGDAALRVRLVDQSATGFMIAVDKHPGVYPGEVVWLQTSAGWTEVRVVKVRQEVDGTRIGLERLSDLATNTPSDIGVIKSDHLEQEGSKASPWPFVIMIVLLTGVLGFLGWTVFVRKIDGEYVIVLNNAQPASADPRPAAVQGLETAATRRQNELHQTMREFGAAMLTMPDVVKHLKLTAEQQKRLSVIITAALKTEKELRQSGDTDAAGAKLTLLHQEATAQAMSVLDERQRGDWDVMLKAALEQIKPAADSADEAAAAKP
jgi:hypothetical protein